MPPKKPRAYPSSLTSTTNGGAPSGLAATDGGLAGALQDDGYDPLPARMKTTPPGRSPTLSPLLAATGRSASAGRSDVSALAAATTSIFSSQDTISTAPSSPELPPRNKSLADTFNLRRVKDALASPVTANTKASSGPILGTSAAPPLPFQSAPASAQVSRMSSMQLGHNWPAARGSATSPLPAAVFGGGSVSLSGGETNVGDHGFVEQPSTAKLCLMQAAAMLIVIAICGFSYVCWLMMEGFTTAIGFAVILSVALHEAKGDGNKQRLLRRIAATREAWKARGSWDITVGASPVLVFYYWWMQSLARRTGVDSYRFFKKIPNAHARNVLFAVGLCVFCARLWAVQFSSLPVGILVAALALFAGPAALGLLMCLFRRSATTFAYWMVLFAYSALVSVVVGGVLVSVFNEVKTSGQEAVRTVQSLGIKVPDNALEQALNVVLSKNTTDALLPALQTFKWNSSVYELYNEGLAFYRNHTATLTAAVTEGAGVAQGIGQSVGTALVMLLAWILWIFYKVYEIIFGTVTLTNLLALDHTVFYYALHKVLILVHGDRERADTKARQAEERLIADVAELFGGYFHLFFLHFSLTLVWYSVCDMPMAVMVSIVGGVVAVLPVSLPPVWSQLIIAAIVMALQRQLNVLFLCIGVVVYAATWIYASSWGQLSGKHHHEAHEPITEKRSKKGKKVAGTIGLPAAPGKPLSAPAVKAPAEQASSSKWGALLGYVRAALPERPDAGPESPTAEVEGIATPTGAAGDAGAFTGSTEKRDSAHTNLIQYLLATSIVCGIANFGASGAVIGPITVLLILNGWEAI